MPFDISGNYTLPTPPTPFVAGTLVKASEMNAVLTDIMTAMNSLVMRSGVTPITGAQAFSGNVTIAGTTTATGVVTGNGGFVGDLTYKGQSVAHSATLAVDFALGSHVIVGTTTANITSITLSNGVINRDYELEFQQNATGGWTIPDPVGSSMAGTPSLSPNQVSRAYLVWSAARSRFEGTWISYP